MRTNYILIDYENVQPEEIPAGGEFPIEVRIFVGSRQTKLSFEFAESIQALGENAEYVKIEGNGPNALDFHIAYYIGKLAAENPNSYFHIVSKDKGFDPLIQHLKNDKVFVRRVNDLSEIQIPTSSHHGTVDERTNATINSFRKRQSGLPGRVKTLENSINASFQKTLSPCEIKEIVDLLRKKKVITISDSKVSYHLSPPEATKKAERNPFAS